MQVVIIGGGNMGSAIAKSLIANKDSGGWQVTVVEKDLSKWGTFAGSKADMKQFVTEVDFNTDAVIILAVKPQNVGEAVQSLTAAAKDKLIISIAAGISLPYFEKILSEAHIVRCMPNTPAMIGKGISGWVAGKLVSSDEKAMTRKIFNCFGEEIEFKNEEYLDAVTAVSGSGPAYMFYFLEAMIAGGKSLGLPEENAKKLAVTTMAGAAALVQASQDDLGTLRNKVTSKGGTTEQAIKCFEEKGLKSIIQEAMNRAWERSKELGKL